MYLYFIFEYLLYLQPTVIVGRFLQSTSQPINAEIHTASLHPGPLTRGITITELSPST